MDDYGGPYREVFQLICDELQSPDPSSSLPSSSSAAGSTMLTEGNSNDTRARVDLAMTPLRHDALSPHTPSPSSHHHRDDASASSTLITTPASSHANHRNTPTSSSSPHPQSLGALPLAVVSEDGHSSSDQNNTNNNTSNRLNPTPSSSIESGGLELNKRAVRCFLPLLHPTPNWSLSSASTECAERYRYGAQQNTIVHYTTLQYSFVLNLIFTLTSTTKTINKTINTLQTTNKLPHLNQ